MRIYSTIDIERERKLEVLAGTRETESFGCGTYGLVMPEPSFGFGVVHPNETLRDYRPGILAGLTAFAVRDILAENEDPGRDVEVLECG